jgi:NAD+ synthase (glutamine-hydrolysing)
MSTACSAAFAHAACGWVERFTTLCFRNQWKRERFAPAFHLDDENLDPKTWCRFPILSGGFRRELSEMAG